MKLHALVVAIAFSVLLLSSCGAQPQPQSGPNTVTEDQIAVEVTKKLSQYYGGLSPGLWDNITFVSYVCQSGDSASKMMPDGTEVVQYAIIPFAITEEDQLTRFHLYYLTKWDGDDCHCSPVKRANLNGEEKIDDEALAVLYDKYFENGFIKEERSFQKDIIAEKADVPVYTESDFQETIAPDEPEAESQSGNEKLMEAWENRNADSDPTGQQQPTPAEINTARHDETTIKVCAHDIALSDIPTPSTAKFCSYSDMETKDLGNGHYQCTGWVDFENQYGAMLRYDFIVFYTATEKGYKEGSVEFFPRG